MFSRLPFSRSAVVAVLVSAVAAVVLGIEVWAAAPAREQVKEQIAKERNLDLSTGELRQRIQVKHAMVADLIAGRTTLAEVSGRFLVMNRDWAEHMDVIRHSFAGTTDEEKAARNVVAFVEASLANNPTADRDEVMSRIGTELEAMLDPHAAATE